MTLTAGSRLGPYEILAPIGAGGMGEVWRAKDLKLDREVAIKVLPARLSNDPAALARFEREAKAVASLSHPNILAIHDFGSSSGDAFAVMELLEGETLRERLEVGALPARKALDYAIQIANGLAAAHEKGIVHRDLKPENLFVTGDGRVKILDFGLAKVAERALDATTSPTVAAGSGTEPGTLMGSVGYMSPEQVRGAPADHRSDIFSFGAVLYEMLTGVRAFRRDTSAETMTAILKDDPPDFPTSSGAISPALLRIVEHCMEKNPQERFQSARDLAFDLGNVTGISAESAGGAPSRVSGSGRGRRVLTILSLLFAGALVGAAIATRLRPAAETEPVRIHSLTFSSHDSEPSASPDGRLIAFTSWRDGQSRIWIKQITGGGEVPLTAGSDRRPRFSPDGSSVLFIRDLGTSQAVYRVPLVGGDVHKLIDNAVDADWAPDGRRIAFVRIRKGGGANGATLLVLDTETGKETSLLQEKDDGMFGPRWSPDGRSIAIARGNRNRNSASWMLLRIDSETGRMLPIPQNGPGNALGGIAWSGRGREMFFVQSASVMGDISGAGSRILRLDLSTGKRTTLLWADGLATVNGTEGAVTLCDVLSSGRLLFSERMRRQNLREITLGPAGAVGAPRLLTSGSSIDRQPVYSPDGKRLLFSSNRSGNLDLWVIEPATGISRQLTDDAAQDWDPAFTPDGAHILWSCDRHGHLEAWIANADGSGARQLSDDGADAENPTETRDGKWIVYWSGNSKKAGIWKIHPDGTGATRLVSGSFVATEVSPDGRYCLFNDQDQSNLRGVVRCVEIESGRVLPFAIPVPYTLGAPGIIYGRARWSPDGRSIYFIGQDAAGLSGVFAQEFSPERDTTSTRHPVAGFSNEYVTESLGLSPDGTRLTISTGQEFGTIMLADGVTGAAPPARKAP